MKKLFGAILLIIAVTNAVAFFSFFNIASSITESKIKGALESGKIYDNIAFYIKNEIVTNSDFQLNVGSNFENLNQSINAENIKLTIDDGLHNIFLAIESSGENPEIIPLKFSSQNPDGSQFSFEKYFNINDNIVFEILSRKNTILFSLAGSALLFLIIGVLIFIKKPQDSLMFMALFSLATAILLAGITILSKVFASGYVETLVSQINLFKEVKLLAMLQRFLSIIISNQFYYYLAETIGLFVFSMTFFSLRKILQKEDLKEIDSKI